MLKYYESKDCQQIRGSLKGDYIKKELFVYVWNLFNYNCCIPPGWGWEEFQVVSVWNVEKLTTNVFTIGIIT